MKGIKKRTTVLKSLLLVLLLAASTQPASANWRRFSYIYESAVMPKDAREIELWNTLRINKKNFYRRLDQRIEYEWGLGGGVQTALYLNHTSKASQSSSGIETENELSFSNEWKFKLMDAYADPIGLGLYAEWGAAPAELELEGKLLIDKALSQDLFLAANAIYEMEFKSEFEDGEVGSEEEKKLEFVLGLSYDLGEGFAVGLEGRHHSVMFDVTELSGNDPNPIERSATFSAIFAGPTLSYHGSNWWIVATFLPQISGTADESSDKYDLVEHQKAEARLLFSFELD